MFRGRRDHGRGNLGVMLLFFQLMNFGFDKIPPVTLVTILVQVAIFLGVGDLTRWFPSSYDVCMSTHLVLRQKQWSRLILSTLFHASDMHLYFNMVSLLWKGVMLEKKFRSQYFGYLLVVFTVLSSVMYVALNFVIAEVFRDKSYELQCAVGFSGVIFALKVLSIHYSPPGLHYALGFIPVPSKYIYWVELGIIQLIYPQASFTGHLAGICVGLLYTKGPLKFVMDSFIPSEPSYTYRTDNTGYRHTNTRAYRIGGRSAPEQDYAEYNRRYDDRGPTDRGQAGQGDRGPADRGQATGQGGRGDNFEDYTGGLSEEEQIRRATEESSRQNTGPNEDGSRLYPNLDELRRRRADRYT